MIRSRKFYTTIAVVVITLAFVGYCVYLSLSGENNAVRSASSFEQNSLSQQSSTLQDDAEVKPDNAQKSIPEEKKPEIIKYTIKTGDTLESIAKSYDVKVSTISESSGISVNSILKEGQELTFPSVDGILYKIKSGETLSDFASTYDIDIDDIVAVNNMESADKLKIGQQIIIPGIEKLKVETKPVVAAKSTVKIVASRSGSSVASSGATIWPARGTITSLYGPRWGKNHNGIDIAAPTGSNVTAFRSGTVVFSGWDNGGYGNLVIIDHGNGLQSYYGHNSQLIVKKGQSVSAGQLIAKVGSTGDSTGPHCHFEVRKNGTPVNPYNYLK